MPENKIIISIIIPNYNHSKYLRQRFDTILNQTYKDYELIILDDGSSDNSLEIIQEYVEKYPGIITCFNENNNGSAFKQWNRGISLSKGEYIWIAESDDFADSHFLERAINEISRSEKIGLVFTDTWVLDEEKGIKYRFSDRKKAGETCVKKITTHSLVKNPIPNASSIIFRREAYINAGYADETMKFCADWFLSLKIAMSHEVIHIPDALSIYRLHQNSSYHRHLTSNQMLIEKWKISLYLIKNSGFSVLLYYLITKLLFKVWVLRFMHILKVPSFLMPEIPRRPGKYKFI